MGSIDRTTLLLGAAVGAGLGAAAGNTAFMVATVGTNLEFPWAVHREAFPASVPATIAGGALGAAAGIGGALLAVRQLGGGGGARGLVVQVGAAAVAGALAGASFGAATLPGRLDWYPPGDRGVVAAQQVLGYALPGALVFAAGALALRALRH